MKNISVLGSTGSIGVNTLKIAKKHGFSVVARACNSNLELFEQQCRQFMPKIAAMYDTAAANDLKVRLADTDIKVLSGEEGVLCAASCEGADIVLNAVVGIAGLKPTVAAIQSKKTLALANKESLVTAGDIVMKTAKDNGVDIIPVDSEHSAIFQCLNSKIEGKLKKIILTASGGPFFGKTKEELQKVTPQMALKHPNWNMGQKVTIDSATLFNKGLEVIEAMHLFGVTPADIEVVVHPQSIVHSAVEFCDNSVIAQMGVPDMKIPIQLALTYPKRLDCDVSPLSLSEIGNLGFFKPDLDTFLALKTCIYAATKGGLKPCAANGADEVAVKMFLQGKIKFTDIGELIKKAVDNQKEVKTYNIDDVFEADKAAKQFVLSHI